MLALFKLGLGYTYMKMSEEQLKAFIAKVQARASLQEELKIEGADVVAVAKAAGFSIRTEEIHSHHQSLSEELSDEELEDVAGGGGLLCNNLTHG